MTSATPSSQSQLNAASNANAVASSSTSGTTTPAAAPAPLPIRSYASAATKNVQDNAQHGKVSPVNGAKNNSNSQSANMQNGEHGRKPSVTISASGTTGQIPNGGTASQSSTRPNINFGSMNGPTGSPAIASSAPNQPQTPSLNAPKDPRVTSPTHSPSPIPQPAASGGKPPSTLPNQSNGLSFGSMGAENGDASRGPQAPNTPGQQPAHIRNESAHSDASMRGNFVPQGGRGRGGYNMPYNQSSPAQSYRQIPNNRGPSNMPPQFQNPQAMGFSPSRGRGGSPMMMQAQPFVPNQPQMHGGFPQHHLNPQQQAYFGAQPPYDPSYGYYQPYYPQQQFPHGGAPPSPRPSYPVPFGGPPAQSFHPMSRSGSQISDRPSSSVGQPASAPNTAPSAPGTPAQASQSFQAPAKKTSKAIVIKNEKGEEITFEKKASPAPSAVAQSPAIVSSAPTPPPRTPSVQHNRAESSAKSAAETKNQFQEQVKAQLEARKAKEEEEKRAVQEKEEAQAKVVKDKEDAEAKLAQDKVDAANKAAQDKEDAEKKAADEKEAAEKKAIADKEAADKAAADKAAADKAEAEKKAAEKAEAEKKAAEKAEAEKKAAEKEAADKAAADKEAADKAAADKAAADKEAADKKAADKEAADKAAADKEATDKKAAEDAAAKAAPAEKEETEDERFEREIAEMEAAEKAEEERERAYNEKRKKQKAEEAKVAAAKADEDMKRAEREAEELEAAREKEREGKGPDADKDEAAKLFASLKKPTLGPGAEAETADSTAAPEPERAAKPKPAALKLETSKPVEAAQPTPGMRSLQSARFLELKNTQYPSGFQSPNPALNQTGKRAGKEYDMDFLLQFQDIFKEKPSVDWDNKIKETLGDSEPASARAGSSRGGNMSVRQGSRGAAGNTFTAMGNFANSSRTLPRGTTSDDRFAASQAQNRGGLGSFSGRPGGAFPMGAPQGISRTNSLQTMAPGSPKVGGSSRRGGGGGGGGSRRGPSQRHDDRREADSAKTMPLTAGMDLKPLEKSTTGWTPRSIVGAPAPVDPSGQMAPDMVQRKVKAALNKMTPENFDRISDQIMAISDQSKNEKDGRTLRQVIQLTFEKACDEAHWAGTYAKFCYKMLHSMSNEIVDETIRDRNNNPVVGGGLFRKYLLNRCQEEFERGWEANLPEKPEGESQEAALLSDEYYIAAAAKRRGLGLIQFIGELYKLNMLTVKIMHQCVLRLLNFEGQPDESAVENLSKLLKAVGATMDSTDQGRQLVDMYYQRLQSVLDTHKDMPSRSRFMLMDIVDLRKSGWKSRDSDKGPKTIEQIHAEAEAAAAAAEVERQKNSSQRGGRPQMGRGDARGFGHQNMPPPDYQRNTVGMDDLRRLQNRNTSRQASSGMGPLGPGGFMASRSSSGRKGLGPPRDGESSGPSSRSGTPLNQKKEETSTHVNAFSALAALDGSEESAEAQGAPSEAGSPPVTKAQPASIDAAANDNSNDA